MKSRCFGGWAERIPYFMEHGTKVRLKTLDQQNMQFKIIMAMAKLMFKSQMLEKSLWAIVVADAIYTLNQCSIRTYFLEDHPPTYVVASKFNMPLNAHNMNGNMATYEFNWWWVMDYRCRCRGIPTNCRWWIQFDVLYISTFQYTHFNFNFVS